MRATGVREDTARRICPAAGIAAAAPARPGPDPALDRADDRFGLGEPVVQHQPARAFRHVAAQQQDAEAEPGADAEPGAPAQIRRQPAGLQKGDRAAGPERRTQPEAAVDRQIGAPAIPRRHQFLDRRIDRRILAADAGAGQKAEQGETGEIPRAGGGRGRGQVDGKSDEEQFAPSEPVGQIAEEQRAGDRPGEIEAADRAHLGGGEMQHRALLQGAGDRAGQGHFEPVEDPGDAEGRYHQGMKPGPWQPVEPGRDIGCDDRGAVCHRGDNAPAAESAMLAA